MNAVERIICQERRETVRAELRGVTGLIRMSEFVIALSETCFELLQERVEIVPRDDSETLQERLQKLEECRAKMHEQWKTLVGVQQRMSALVSLYSELLEGDAGVDGTAGPAGTDPRNAEP